VWLLVNVQDPLARLNDRLAEKSDFTGDALRRPKRPDGPLDLRILVRVDFFAELCGELLSGHLCELARESKAAGSGRSARRRAKSSSSKNRRFRSIERASFARTVRI